MATEIRLGFIEPGERQDGLDISAQTLHTDNHSLIAQANLAAWGEARLQTDLTAYDKCSDARGGTIRNNATVSVSTIAAAMTPTERLATSRGIGRWVTMTHFDGDTIIPGQPVAGCGGLLAKGDEESVRETEIHPYVREVIADKDALVQSLRTAEKIADLSGKPVAAWAQDHRTYDIYPIAVFQKNGNGIRRESAIRDYQVANYRPEEIYADGVPTLDEELLPDEFRELLERNRLEQRAIISRYPDLREMQRVQRPRMVLWSTDIRSASIKLPRFSAIPGSIFKVFTPREKLDDESTMVSPDAIATSLRQLWYPIAHAVSHAGDSSKSFSNTDRLIIETPSLNLSRQMAAEALERPWMRNWINLDGRRIILLQSNAGIINDAAELAA